MRQRGMQVGKMCGELYRPGIFLIFFKTIFLLFLFFNLTSFFFEITFFNFVVFKGMLPTSTAVNRSWLAQGDMALVAVQEGWGGRKPGNFFF